MPFFLIFEVIVIPPAPPRLHLNFHNPTTFNPVYDIINTLSNPKLGLTGLNSPAAIYGHSLGGWISLQYLHTLCSSTRQLNDDGDMELEPPRQTWVLNYVPGQADPSVHSVLRAISSLPTHIPLKAWLVDTLVKEYSMNKAVAMWMATNLRDRGDKSFDWIFDLSIANELVDNFSDQNFVELIHDVTTATSADGAKSSNSTVQLVMAGKNNLWSEEIDSELQSIPSFQKSSPSSLFQMHTLDKAGHWVHVDDVDGLLKLMVTGLR